MSRMNTRAVLALVLVASLQALASPITGITFAAGPEQALAVRAPAPAAAATARSRVQQLGADRYVRLATLHTRDDEHLLEARLLNHVMIEPGLAIRAADESESEDTEEAETDDEAEFEETVEEVIERRGNSRVFATSARPILAGMRPPHVIPNPKDPDFGKLTATPVRTTTTTTSAKSTATTTPRATTAPSTTITTTTTTTTTTTSTRAVTTTRDAGAASIPTGLGCFPSNVRTIPTGVNYTAADLAVSWWCADSSEYAFMGFSYSVDECQSPSTLLADFTRMRKQFGARYVRLYGACDATWFNDALVDAAASANLGSRYSAFVKTMRTNPKAPFVFKNVAIGSEPLYDGVLSATNLATEILSMKSKMAPYGTKVTFSEMPYGLQINNGAPSTMAAADFVEGNVLPFFDSQATTGANAWGVVSWSLSYFASLAPGKIIRMTQTGWPSDQSVWKANTPTAVSSILSQASYYALLDSKCSWFNANGGIGWFAHIYSDDSLPGWGLLNNGNLKFPFAPKSSC
ncbi:BQ5605_C040g11914 [Microbotryum silenes-dioicae]|uniref:glucan endo-1,3-beta-D-glucosidase n=1 Tax=Microbotryum silenes-dioicae TaxID=796604 RepID=A0A2X0MTZ1_9BASI|nr:BQ5605_C040g11914 [Microbotryum silenes-dioicae]